MADKKPQPEKPKKRQVAVRRKVIAPGPSRAQSAFLTRFEAVFTAPDEQIVAAFTKEKERFYGQNPKAFRKRTFSKSTYHSWRRQTTSPDLHEVEILCRVAGQRQTLIIDPTAGNVDGGGDVGWIDEADELLREMANLPAHQRSAVVGELRGIIKTEMAKAAKQNPPPSDET